MDRVRVQVLVQNPSPISEKGKGNLDSGLSLKSYGPPTTPTHPQLLSIKKAYNEETQRVKGTQNDPSNFSGGQQEGEHVVAHSVQGNQRNYITV